MTSHDFTIFDLLTDRCDHCKRSVHSGGGLVYLGPESCYAHPDGENVGVCPQCGCDEKHTPLYWDNWLNKRFNMPARFPSLSENDIHLLKASSRGRGVITFSSYDPFNKRRAECERLAFLGLVADDYFDSEVHGRPMVAFTITDAGRNLLERLS